MIDSKNDENIRWKNYYILLLVLNAIFIIACALVGQWYNR